MLLYIILPVINTVRMLLSNFFANELKCGSYSLLAKLFRITFAIHLTRINYFLFFIDSGTFG